MGNCCTKGSDEKKVELELSYSQMRSISRDKKITRSLTSTTYLYQIVRLQAAMRTYLVRRSMRLVRPSRPSKNFSQHEESIPREEFKFLKLEKSEDASRRYSNAIVDKKLDEIGPYEWVEDNSSANLDKPRYEVTEMLRNNEAKYTG